jgi:hypothetical protein
MNEYTYKVIENSQGENIIKRTDSNGVESWIPSDLGNSDYVAYLESLNDDTEAE